MSDFLFSTTRRPEGELRRTLERYLGHVSVAVDERHGAWGSLAVARAFHDPADVVVEEDGVLTVLIGDPVVRSGAPVPGRASAGGRRREVHRLLAHPPRGPWDEHLDGAFAALAVDVRGGGSFVLTDLAAFIPLFQAENAGCVVAGTHLDCVARAAGRTEMDLASAVDLIATLACVYPHTLYDGVRQFPPAAVGRLMPGGGWAGEPERYWEPVEHNPYGSVAEVGEALREALLADVRAATEGAAEAGLLLSGGEDARAVLAAVPDGVAVRAFVFAEWENREVRVARAAARAYGAEVVWGPRAPDDYASGLPEVARMIGGHSLGIDVHGWGLHERLGIRELPVVLGGFSADALLKGNYVDPRRSVSINLPAARPELLAEVARRHEAWQAALRGPRPETFREWYRLWPFGGRKHSGNVDGNRRLFASHEPFHAAAVLKLAAAVPAEWKQRRRLFHAAARPLFRRAWHVPHARSRFPYFGTYANWPLGALLRAGRGVRDLARGELRARQGGWPKWRRVSGSPAADGLWEAFPPADTPLAGIFAGTRGGDIQPRVRRSWHPLRQMMLLQLAMLSREGG